MDERLTGSSSIFSISLEFIQVFKKQKAIAAHTLDH